MTFKDKKTTEVTVIIKCEKSQQEDLARNYKQNSTKNILKIKKTKA